MGSSIRRAHFALRGDYPRPPRPDRLAAPRLGLAPLSDHAGMLRRRVARVSSAHGHQLRLLRNARTDWPPQNSGRRSPLHARAIDDLLRIRRSPQAPPMVRPAIHLAVAGLSAPSESLKLFGT